MKCRGLPLGVRQEQLRSSSCGTPVGGVRLIDFVHELLSILQIVFGESGRIVSSWKIRPWPVFLEDQLAAWDL